MPSWIHLGVGFGILGLFLLGASKATSSGVSGGGERLITRTVEVEGRTYHVIRREESIYEIFSTDDPDAWAILDMTDDDKIVTVSKGPKGEDVIVDLPKFPDIFT